MWMKALLIYGSLALLAASGCAKKDQDKAQGADPASASADLCTRGVNHVNSLMEGQGGHKPSADEQRAIEGVTKMSIAQCEKEGFTQAQLDCVLAAKTWDDFKKIADCEAIKAKRPSWLIIP